MSARFLAPFETRILADAIVQGSFQLNADSIGTMELIGKQGHIVLHIPAELGRAMLADAHECGFFEEPVA